MRRDDEPGYGSPEWNSRAFAQADRWRLIKLEQFVHGGPYFTEHRQDEPADVWLIEHGWGHKPSVQILNTSGEVVYADVQHLDDDRLEIRFAVPSAGSAVLSLGAAPAPVIRTDQPPKEAHGLTERQIRLAAQEVRIETGRAPTRVRVAAKLDTSESTLKRAMNELGMLKWPPAPPKNDLI